MESGQKPVRPFTTRKDFNFWKTTVKKTDFCVKKGAGSPSVSSDQLSMNYLNFYIGMLSSNKIETMGAACKENLSGRVCTFKIALTTKKSRKLKDYQMNNKKVS